MAPEGRCGQMHRKPTVEMRSIVTRSKERNAASFRMVLIVHPREFPRIELFSGILHESTAIGAGTEFEVVSTRTAALAPPGTPGGSNRLPTIVFETN